MQALGKLSHDFLRPLAPLVEAALHVLNQKLPIGVLVKLLLQLRLEHLVYFFCIGCLERQKI